MSTLVFLILEFLNSLSRALSSLIYSFIYMFNKRYVLELGLGFLHE